MTYFPYFPLFPLGWSTNGRSWIVSGTEDLWCNLSYLVVQEISSTYVTWQWRGRPTRLWFTPSLWHSWQNLLIKRVVSCNVWQTWHYQQVLTRSVGLPSTLNGGELWFIVTPEWLKLDLNILSLHEYDFAVVWSVTHSNTRWPNYYLPNNGEWTGLSLCHFIGIIFGKDFLVPIGTYWPWDLIQPW